ncbi:hypothetical protein [Sinorhizobium sp. RAC02]|uniref:hypothetical protein n=1 Tax=Sinorhizobium sp. RAC02 TaxID=1842534 RepID=UPI00083D8EB8|nr:hypothetical protein [Sinorhizobium sp. RAC02]AOF88994.1 hypothetical protein BSY16_4001 [Sinorhizobium sp. RAC02]
MAKLAPSSAGILVRHYEDGKMRVFIDGKPICGVVNVEVKQAGKDRATLHLEIVGVAYRMETSPLGVNQDRAETVGGELVPTADDRGQPPRDW